MNSFIQANKKKFSIMTLALSLAIASFGFALSASADVDPVGCTDNGGGVSIAAFRSDGITNIGAGTVVDGEAINYKATLSALPTPNCAFQGGTWTLTTPDGVVHALGAVPRIGGTGVASITSALVPYTVNHANEIVNTTRHIDAVTNYGGGISHADTLDETTGPQLQSSKIVKVIHTPTITTDIHDASHAVVTSVPAGTVVHDSAAVAGTPVATGTVTFTQFTDAQCSAGAVVGSPVALVSGVADGSAPFTTTAAGSLSYKAHYNGQAGVYNEADGPCEPLTITKRDSSTSTDIHNATHGVITSAVVGDMIHDKATVSPAISGPTPTGNISFQLYSDGVCQATSGSPEVIALSSGSAESSAVSAVAPAMSYQASYAGDGVYNESVGACEPLTVSLLSPTVVTEVHDALEAVISAPVPSPVTAHDKATVSGSGPVPTGTVDFTFYNDNSCASQGTASGTGVALVAGVAHPSTSQGPLSAGSYAFKAHYNGDVVYSTKDGACEPFTVVDQGHIIVDKVTNPAGDLQSFAFTTTGTGYAGFSLTDTATPNDQTLNAGNYSVAETPVSGWIQTSVTCTDGTASVDPSNISLVAGHTVKCTFLNTKAQYCSPGYWKNHLTSWVTYTPSQLFSSVFEQVTIMWSAKGKPAAVANPTLAQALDANGGGINALVRATVNALLNASSGLVTGMTTTDVINAFNAVVPGTDAQYSATAASFTAPENCPLN